MKPFHILLCGLLLGATAPAQAGDLHDLLVEIGLGPVTAGSGTVKTERRSLQDFDAILVEDSSDVSVTVGDSYGVSVTTDDNLLSLVGTSVEKNSLVIRTRGNYRTRHTPKIEVHLPKLTALRLDGSGDVTIKGVNGGELAVQIVGSGDIAIAGKGPRLTAIIEGSGDVDARELQVGTAQVRIDGSGDVHVRASESLDAVVNGSGDVVYRGKPGSVRQQINGSGSVYSE